MAYFCQMPIKKSILFGNLFALLVLISYSVAAKDPGTITEFHQQQLSLNKAADSVHENMLQTAIVHISMVSAQPVKAANPGFGILAGSCNVCLLLHPAAPAIVTQDADRCESVSRLLFPYHIFW